MSTTNFNAILTTGSADVVVSVNGPFKADNLLIFEQHDESIKLLFTNNGTTNGDLGVSFTIPKRNGRYSGQVDLIGYTAYAAYLYRMGSATGFLDSIEGHYDVEHNPANQELTGRFYFIVWNNQGYKAPIDVTFTAQGYSQQSAPAI
ncbi:hypothetical protein [Pseudomonas pharyngis]|uniref:hypothetical protein n=1 Tax=Pseudomonas pharyngis TaxID=2892333 RepID=UPI001F2ED268|nr:hypothetical protein [Pseudomonas pharyngis]